MQVVMVKFRDPTTFDYWATMDEIDKSEPRVCYACGFLIEENDDVTKVALLLSEDREIGRDWITIPTSCILSCEVIKEVDWEVPNAR